VGALGNYVWLLGQAFDGLFEIWQPTIILLSITICVFVWQYRRDRSLLKRKNLWMLSPLIITVSIILIGALCAQDPSKNTLRFPGAEYIVQGLFLLHFPILIALMIKFKPYKWFALAFSVLVAWISFWATFVSVMSVTGNWL
jgi:hypothetical protein